MSSNTLPPILDTDFEYDNLNGFHCHQSAYNLYKNNADGYGLQFAANLNNALRLNQSLGEMEQYCLCLDQLIASVTNSQQRVLFRATYKSFIDKQLSDGVITDPAFLSTAENRKAITRHFNTSHLSDVAVLEIHYSRDRKLLPMDTNDGNGYTEFEFLLPRKTKLEILDYREMKGHKWLHELFKDTGSIHEDIKTVHYFETRAIW